LYIFFRAKEWRDKFVYPHVLDVWVIYFGTLKFVEREKVTWAWSEMDSHDLCEMAGKYHNVM
jgi:hypothetical protein